MQDKDRGTYSPPTEDQLNLDHHEVTSQPTQVPLTLIVSGIVLVVLLLAVVIFYNSSLSGQSPRELGQSVEGYKDGRVEDAKILREDDLLDSLSASRDANLEPKLATEAETPLSRDPANVINEAPPIVAPNNMPVIGNATSSAASQARETNGLPDEVTDTLKPDTLKSGALMPKPVTAPSDKAAPAGVVTVQIGAFATREIADQAFASLASSYGLFVGGTAKKIDIIDRDGAKLYRTSFIGFAGREKAQAFCDALKASGKACFVR
jgi:SPOR domain